MANYGQGYARQIASTHGSPVSGALKQLARLEEGGILISRLLKALLEKALEASVMDRLAAYFHWNDLQSLDQAVMVASSQAVSVSRPACSFTA